MPKNSAKLLASFSLLLFLGCGSKGPRVTYCISDPENMILRCGKVGDEEKTGKSIAQVVGYTCMPPVDAASFLDACNKNVVPPKRNQCVIGDSKENFLFHCFDQATQGSKNLAFKDTDNFVCMDANDFLFVVDYCQQKRLNKK